MAGELEGCKSLSGLLGGLAQSAFHGQPGIPEELLHGQLYPEVPLEEFRPFLAKMRGVLKMRLQVAAHLELNHLPHALELGQHIMVEVQELLSIASADMDSNQLEAFLTAQTKKQGGITSEQAAVISKFWKSHKTKIRESLMNQSCWDNRLRGLSWRVDSKSQSRQTAQIHTPVAMIELEFGKGGQVSPSP
ncbi:COMM domain-containing protein 1 isoform X2 [Psammomys obesus]|uniref:COMM domain-containing protein 1 isoform X2 n=1 Tax=Psammomys obesus TaxID=48139 RepID=UPI002452DA5E|nr:COMM domain-containing protein 1 isoform X2 [Psammomys obesus]